MKILSLNEIIVCYGGALSSCDCYDESGQNETHYDGDLKMFKQIMCWHQCCYIDKKYAFQWGANIDPSVGVEKCGFVANPVEESQNVMSSGSFGGAQDV